MPKKAHDCAQKLIDEGKSEKSAWAICTSQFQDQKGINFSDSVSFDCKTKKGISLRDGIQEYYGHELGFEPLDAIFTVYRSPATVAKCSQRMNGLPLTKGHVSTNEPVSVSYGNITETDLIDNFESNYNSTIAVQNLIDVNPNIEFNIENGGERELSLGYKGDLVLHDVYDFEQINLIPHHLAVVTAGRCGATCSFIDKKGDSQMAKRTEQVSLNKAFLDEDGKVNLQQVVEIAMQLPDALKTIPMDELQKVLPTLQGIVEMGNKGAEAAENETPEEEAAEQETGGEETEMQDGDMGASEDDKEKKSFGDAKAFQDAVASAVNDRMKVMTHVVQKARNFVDSSYSFEGKTPEQIMRDTLKAGGQTGAFSDSELPIAFKMLQPVSKYQEFGDTKQDDTSLSSRIENDLD